MTTGSIEAQLRSAQVGTRPPVAMPNQGCPAVRARATGPVDETPAWRWRTDPAEDAGAPDGAVAAERGPWLSRMGEALQAFSCVKMLGHW